MSDGPGYDKDRKTPDKNNNNSEDTADRLIEDREKPYGDVRETDQVVRKLFRIRTGIDLPAGAYPMFLQCVKIAREWHAHGQDNLDDFGAYRKLEDFVKAKGCEE